LIRLIILLVPLSIPIPSLFHVQCGEESAKMPGNGLLNEDFKKHPWKIFRQAALDQKNVCCVV